MVLYHHLIQLAYTLPVHSEMTFLLLWIWTKLLFGSLFPCLFVPLSLFPCLLHVRLSITLTYFNRYRISSDSNSDNFILHFGSARQYLQRQFPNAPKIPTQCCVVCRVGVLLLWGYCRIGECCVGVLSFVALSRWGNADRGIVVWEVFGGNFICCIGNTPAYYSSPSVDVLLVLGLDEKLVVHRLDEYLLRAVLGHVEPQFQLLLCAARPETILQQGRVQSLYRHVVNWLIFFYYYGKWMQKPCPALPGARPSDRPARPSPQAPAQGLQKMNWELNNRNIYIFFINT